MSRRHRARNNYPEGYAEHSVEMDWRKERDADNEQLEKTVARAELAEHVLIGTISSKWRYIAVALIVGIFIGYFTRLISA